MVNLLKVKTIRNFINVVKIGIVLFKYLSLIHISEPTRH